MTNAYERSPRSCRQPAAAASKKSETELGAIGELNSSIIKHSAMNTKKLDTDTAQPTQRLAHQTNEGRGSRVQGFPLQRLATRTACVRKRECCKRRTSTCDLRRYVFKLRDSFSSYSYKAVLKESIFVFVHVWQKCSMMQPAC